MISKYSNYIFKFHKTVEISNFNTEINSFLVYEQSSIREISNEHIEIDNIINNKWLIILKKFSTFWN